MGSTPPPWRSFDAPTVTGQGDGASAPGSPPGASDLTIASLLGTGTARVAATIGLATICAVAAFVLATSGGSAADVVVDGGTVLPGSSAESSGLAPVGGVEVPLVVEIVGAVAEPGVYRLPDGARVGDLVEAAGGFGARVDTARTERELNQAALLRDGDQIRVPSRDDPPTAAGAPSSGTTTESTDGPIDLNQATAAQLDALPGIGPVTIEKILAARDEAPFTSVEELRSRGLLGEKTFERIRESLVVR